MNWVEDPAQEMKIDVHQAFISLSTLCTSSHHTQNSAPETGKDDEKHLKLLCKDLYSITVEWADFGLGKLELSFGISRMSEFSSRSILSSNSSWTRKIFFCVHFLRNFAHFIGIYNIWQRPKDSLCSSRVCLYRKINEQRKNPENRLWKASERKYKIRMGRKLFHLSFDSIA